MAFSEEQIAALAPDASALKSGRDLAQPGKWQLRGRSDKALWGHCQGSGSLPYQTQIDLQNIAFKCNCPSRKFPCKHGLGLLLLYVRQPNSFTADAEPDWVNDWLKKRTGKTEKEAAQKDKPVDAEARAKRIDARNKKVIDGADDLHFWIKDLVRTGLVSVPEKAFSFWREPAKRMVDAQAPGLAGMVKNLGAVNYYADGWQYDLLNRLVKIYTVCEGFKNLETMPAGFDDEIKTAVGFNQLKEELLAQTGVTDHWIVINRSSEKDEQITVNRYWLHGINTGKYAMVLQFIVAGQLGDELNLVAGACIKAELVFYKGVNNYRALIKQQSGTTALSQSQGYGSLLAAQQHFSNCICANPLVEKVPVLIDKVRLIKTDRPWLADETGCFLPLLCSEEVTLRMLAITGGGQFSVHTLISEKGAWPLALWIANKFYSINSNAA
jgi:hypothetical protein